MNAGRQARVSAYPKVKRLALTDVWFLYRRCAASGRPFRPGDGVVMCDACRRIVKYGEWRKAGSEGGPPRCPLCGCEGTRRIGKPAAFGEGAFAQDNEAVGGVMSCGAVNGS